MTEPCEELIARLSRPAIPTIYWICKRCGEKKPFSLEMHLYLVSDDLMVVCSKCAAELDQNNDENERSEQRD